MENDREVDSVMMNINRTSSGIISAVTFSARMTFKLLSFIMRLAKKGLVAASLSDKFQNFIQKTGGEYSVYNIPLTAEKAATMQQMNKLELELQKTNNPIKKASIRSELKKLEKEIPELAQLKELGIDFCALPKLNGSDQTIQVAIAREGDQHFKAWFMNHLTSGLNGGEKNLEGIRVFTEGNYSILNMPFETTEDLGVMMADFNTYGINYAILPDLNVGDGYTQVAIPNSERSLVEQWFKLWKEKALSEGKEVKDLYALDNNSYTQTGELTPEQYINSSEPQFQEVQKEFEAQSTPVPWNEKLAKENSPEFVKLLQDNNFHKITINKESLVENHELNDITRKFENEFGQFTSRIPGTFGDNQKSLVLPSNQVFSTDDDKTFIAFIDKRKDYHVVAKDGTLSKIGLEGEDGIRQTYDKVDRGFNQVKEIQNGKTLSQTPTKTPDIKPSGSIPTVKPTI